MTSAAQRIASIAGLFLRPEFARFVIVGGVNTALTFVMFWVMVEVIHLHYFMSLSIAWVFGVAFNYSLNLVWSFKAARRPEFDARFVRYAVVYFSAFLLNTVLLSLAVEVAGMRPLLAQFFIMPVIVALNYLAVRFWALRQKRH